MREKIKFCMCSKKPAVIKGKGCVKLRPAPISWNILDYVIEISLNKLKA